METDISVQAMDALCLSIAEQRKKIDEMEAAVTVENKLLAQLEAKAVETLDALGRENYKSEFGTVSIREQLRWNLPAGPDAWSMLFNHFKEKGIYEGMVTVNSQKLNSFAKGEFETAVAEGRGMEFFIPGLEAPKMHKSLSFRKGK